MNIRVQSATSLRVDRPMPAAYPESAPVLDRTAPPPEAPRSNAPLRPAARRADGVAPAEPSGGAPRSVAVFVTHGMGQQLRFATLDMVANGLEKALKRWTFDGRAVTDVTVTARTAPLGDVRTQRLEMGVQLDGADSPLAVHLYEGYWAPLTEGRVTLRDVMRFLVRGAWNGLKKGVGQPFERYMFGHNAIHRVQIATFLGLLTTALVLGSLVLLNTVVAAVVIEAGYDVLAGPAAEASASVVAPALTNLVTAYLGATLLLGIAVIATTAAARYDGPRPGRAREAWLAVLTAGVVAWVAATLLTGMLTLSVLLHAAGLETLLGGLIEPLAWAAGLLIVAALVGGALSLLHGRRLVRGYVQAQMQGEAYDGRPLSGFLAKLLSVVLTGAVVASVAYAVVWMSVEGVTDGLARGAFLPAALATDEPWFRPLVWFSLFGVSALIRNVIVQYFGDVAAYVSAHTLDRFAELREAIRDAVDTILDGIYHSRAPDGTPAYDDVAVVGHSLGSVVAYDALNRVLTEDVSAAEYGEGVDVLGRTRLLLTFGSPLDKTAYIFRAQNQSLSRVREALATAVQPLIQNVSYRAFPWVNVHSPRDVIGSGLDLYDPPVTKGYQRKGLADGGAGAGDVHRQLALLREVVGEPGCPYCVLDVRDPGARIPLVAHNEHWRTRAVFDVLVAAVVAPVLAPAGEVTAT